jgi:hypothetical protein
VRARMHPWLQINFWVEYSSAKGSLVVSFLTAALFDGLSPNAVTFATTTKPMDLCLYCTSL